MGGTPVASIDLAPEVRHLDVYLAFITLTDKIWNPSTIPIKSLLTVCLVLMLLQSFSLVFKHIATLRGVRL